MKERIVTSTSLLFLATPFCYAKGYSLAVANSIIVILIIIVIVLIVMGYYSLRHNRIIPARRSCGSMESECRCTGGRPTKSSPQTILQRLSRL